MNESAPIYYDDLDIKVQLGSLNINVLYIRYETARSTWNVENHFHSSYELHFIPFGQGILKTGKGSYELQQNTFYLTGPNVYHEQKTDKINPMSEFAISFEVIKNKKCKRANELHNDGELDIILSTFNNTHFWIGQDEYSNIELFRMIFWELENKQVGYYFNVQSLITQIIINAARCCMKKKESSCTAPTKFTNDKRRFILDFYFGECYRTLTFEELVSKLDVSKRQLNRIIKQYYNTTFKEKLMSIKLQNAMHFLKNTSLPIEKISENVGFTSTSHFYRAFKSCCGITPKEFRDKK